MGIKENYKDKEHYKVASTIMTKEENEIFKSLCRKLKIERNNFFYKAIDHYMNKHLDDEIEPFEIGVYKNKTKKDICTLSVLLTITEREEIDFICYKKKITKSKFLRYVLMHYIDNHINSKVKESLFLKVSFQT